MIHNVNTKSTGERWWLYGSSPVYSWIYQCESPCSSDKYVYELIICNYESATTAQISADPDYVLTVFQPAVMSCHDY